ncbi:hypothetical protein IE979_18240 [Klebsiella pneumoniae]|uniref:Uncharacterized protein n=1 Tax=Klebsiella pneumoniae TaxID=573 RepID=A0A927DY63_KLEPN|nr:hypothetical protein [Klebsiella pneumoniae]MBD3716192.1 hypothetical protein [Klebsiella pneumoniae]MBD3719684.1 hypothetical protein [Klebsiella pneumoniae]
MKSPSCRMGFLRFCRPASVRVCPPVALRLPGLQKRSPDKVRSTAFIASQNSVTNACGMVNRIVNLPDDTSRKIIISSYD